MRHLHIDIETFCNVSVVDVGAYRYAQDPSFRIILFAYQWDNNEPVVVDTYDECFPGENIPADVWEALTDPAVLKIAHNANFETVCISTYYGLKLDPSQWFCTQVGAAYLGLPLSLDNIGKALGLSQQKDKAGKALITFFSMPCRPTKKNGGRTINRPEHDPEKWEAFKEYNAQDVRTEDEIFKYLQRFDPMPPIEWKYWQQDQEINNRGVGVDIGFIDAAMDANVLAVTSVHDELIYITGVSNPNSVAQLKEWIGEQLGHEVTSLSKESLQDHLDSEFIPDEVRRVLELRQQGSNTSVSKYSKMKEYVCEDSRVRGLLQFYGANRTGRYAGRGIQVQNLKRTMGSGLEVAREAVYKGVADLLYDDVQETISQLVRTAFIASPGKSLVSSDFSAIEARVLAWLAGEEWVLDVFNTHGKLYEATASKMFNIPLSSIDKGSEMRQKGKVASLALGYQGAVGALVQMGALREGLTEDELPGIVKRWRVANPKIVKFWKECETVTKYVIKNRSTYKLYKPHTCITFHYEKGYLFITLPSGRRLSYYGAQVVNDKLQYWGMDQVKKTWTKIDTYGGSLVENITQAVARDCLVEAMYRMRDYDIIMHIHDEIVIEVYDDKADNTLNEINKIMAVSPSWAKNLPLSGAGYVSKFYKKD